MTTELADERFKGDVACQVLESERAERLRAFQEVRELTVSGPGWWGVDDQAVWERLGLLPPSHLGWVSLSKRPWRTHSHAQGPGGHLGLAKDVPLALEVPRVRTVCVGRHRG